MQRRPWPSRFEPHYAQPVKRRIARKVPTLRHRVKAKVLVSRIDQLLAQTDPFDLAQAAERHVSTLSGKRIRALLRDAAPRLGDYYRAELARLTGAPTFEEAIKGKYPDAALRSAFVQFLKSNLRAIPIFGGAFGLAVLDHAPLDRAVGIGEERSGKAARAAILAGLALALIVAGAAGERVVAGARAAASSPPPLPLALGTPMPTPQPRPEPSAKASARPAERRVMARVELPPPTPVPQQTQAQASDVVTAPPQPTPTPSPPQGAGSAEVEVTAAPATPSPEPTDLDVEDMPESYSDATPMPRQSLTPAEVPQHAIRVTTPKPSPKPKGWLHRTVMHLDPFKPGVVPHR